MFSLFLQFSYDLSQNESGYLAKIISQEGAKLDEDELLAFIVAESDKEKMDSFKACFDEVKLSLLNDNESASHTPSSNPPEVSGDVEFTIFLKSAGLVSYAQQLVEDGYDSLAALQVVTDEDLIGLGMKRGHRRLLLRLLNEASDTAKAK